MAETPPTSEANHVPRLNNSETYWREATSKNGKKYRVGVPKSDYPDLSEQEVKDLLAGTKRGPPKQSRDSIAGAGDGEGELDIERDSGAGVVYWPPTGYDYSWKDTSQRVKDLFDIENYSLSKTSAWSSTFSLLIHNTQPWDSYDFYDETGDYYRMYSGKAGVHEIEYDSSEPTIVRIVARSL